MEMKSKHDSNTWDCSDAAVKCDHVIGQSILTDRMRIGERSKKTGVG